MMSSATSSAKATIEALHNSQHWVAVGDTDRVMDSLVAREYVSACRLVVPLPAVWGADKACAATRLPALHHQLVEPDGRLRTGHAQLQQPLLHRLPPALDQFEEHVRCCCLQQARARNLVVNVTLKDKDKRKAQGAVPLCNQDLLAHVELTLPAAVQVQGERQHPVCRALLACKGVVAGFCLGCLPTTA